MNDQIEIRCESRPLMNDVAFYILGPVSSDKQARAFGEITMHETPLGSKTPAPSVSISYEQATRLMDELWSTGIRPTQIGTAGHVQAQHEHIGDLRMVVKALLPTPRKDSTP